MLNLERFPNTFMTNSNIFINCFFVSIGARTREILFYTYVLITSNNTSAVIFLCSFKSFGSSCRKINLFSLIQQNPSRPSACSMTWFVHFMSFDPFLSLYQYFIFLLVQRLLLFRRPSLLIPPGDLYPYPYVCLKPSSFLLSPSFSRT